MPKIKKKGSVAKQQTQQEIMTIAHQVTSFMRTYKKQFTAALAVVLAVIVLGAGYTLLRSMQEQKAAPLVAAAHEYYDPSQGTPADYQKALDLFRAVHKKYPNTMSGAIAQYYVGNCLVNLGQRDEAIKEYTSFIQSYASDAFLLGMVYQRLGYVYSGLNRLSDAIKAFEQSEKLNGPGVSTVELAHLYEASGNVLESQNKYKLVLDKLAGTAWSMEAMGKVQKIAPTPLFGTGKEGK
jgi:tetratricopeptide (TPR) repeat protein